MPPARRRGAAHSPSSELIGRKILSAGPGGVRVAYRARKGFANRRGSVQGGILAAMLDSALGIAAAAALGRGIVPVTAQLNVSFVRPATVGTTLVAEARLVHAGRSLAFMEASLRDGDGELLATATATARLVRPGLKR